MKWLLTIYLIWPMALFGLAGCADVTIKDSQVRFFAENAKLAIEEGMPDYAYSNLYYLQTYNTEESKRAYESLIDEYRYKLQIGGQLWLLKQAKSVLNAGNYYTLEEIKNALSKELYFYKTLATHQQYC